MSFSLTNDVVGYEQRVAGVRVDLATDLPAGERRSETRCATSSQSLEGLERTISREPMARTSLRAASGTTHSSDAAAPTRSAAHPSRGSGSVCRCGPPAQRAVTASPAAGAWTRFMALETAGTSGQDAKSSSSAMSSALRSARSSPRYPTLHRRSLTYAVGCPLNEEDPGRCLGRLTLREAGRAHRLLAAGIIPHTPGETSVAAHVRLAGALSSRAHEAGAAWDARSRLRARWMRRPSSG